MMFFLIKKKRLKFNRLFLDTDIEFFQIEAATKYCRVDTLKQQYYSITAKYKVILLLAFLLLLCPSNNVDFSFFKDHVFPFHSPFECTNGYECNYPSFTSMI